MTSLRRLRWILVLLLFPSSASPQEAPPRWHLDPVPEVSIGMVDGPEEYLLFQVQDAAVFSDGTIVVAMYSRDFFELRYYNREGTFIASAGRYGEGPFEVGSGGFLSLERLSDGSIQTLGIGPKYSVFGPKGEPVREGRLPQSPSTRPIGLLDDDHFGVLSVSGDWVAGFRQPGEEEVSFFIHNLTSGGTEPVTSVRYRPSLRAENGLLLRLPFEPKVKYAVGGGRIWIGNMGEAEIQGFSPGGGEEYSAILLSGPPREVTRSDERLWKEHDLGRARPGTTDEQLYAQHHRLVDFPGSFPLFQTFQVDSNGNVWVLRFEPPWSEEDFHWEVFSPAGAKLAEVSIPFEVLSHRRFLRREVTGMVTPIKEIGDDYMLVLQADELGVLRIVKYRLIKPNE